VSDGEQLPAVVRAPAELDLATAPAFRSALDVALSTGAGVVVADMGGTTFCDSSGIKVLVHAAERAQRGGQRFSVRSPSRALQRTIEIVGASALLGLSGP
jgi:anti-anti-sigma factor